jgi:hypothetical protein
VCRRCALTLTHGNVDNDGDGEGCSSVSLNGTPQRYTHRSSNVFEQDQQIPANAFARPMFYRVIDSASPAPAPAPAPDGGLRARS